MFFRRRKQRSNRSKLIGIILSVFETKMDKKQSQPKRRLRSKR